MTNDIASPTKIQPQPAAADDTCCATGLPPVALAETLRPADGTYAGIVPYSPDGVLHHIVWTWGNGGPTTTRIGYNCELLNYITPYKQRRLNANVQDIVGTNGVAAQ